MKVFTSLIILILLLTACAGPSSGSQSSAYQRSLQIGSVTSKNLFLDSSQFANKTIKLRLRNSSGDPALNIDRLRSSIESGLRSAGYKVSDENFGIVMDVNAFQMQSASKANVSSNSGLGAIIGGVVGYEAASRPGGIASGSGAILGAIAGATIEEIIRNHGELSTYLAICDVNIGIVRKEYTKKDHFVIGGNKIEHREPDEADTFNNFAMRETVRVAAFAGDDSSRWHQTLDALLDRLGRVVANLL